MLVYWIPLLALLLRAKDAGAQQQLQQQQQQQHSYILDDQTLQITRDVYGDDGDGTRRFECPAGFFRLRRNCYYLSGGTAPWREAHFQCTARNATLAVLNRHGKDKILRKYLMGDQFRRLERWIGGIYNWRQMNWEWGVSGDKVLFQNFGNDETSSDSTKNYAWHCIVLDPELQYKWNARSCVEHKYFICEVPAGRIGKSRRRKNINNDPLAPQNQRLRPLKRAEYSRHRLEGGSQRRRKNKTKSMRKKNWHQHEDNQIWVHGIKPGSRPPKGLARGFSRRQRLGRNKGPRHGRRQQHGPEPEPKINQVTLSNGNLGAFPADGRSKPEDRLQNLANEEVLFSRLFGTGGDLAREEILLKI